MADQSINTGATVDVWDVDMGRVRTVSRAEAAAGLVRYARRELGSGTPAAAVAERRALDMLAAPIGEFTSGVDI